MSHGVIEGYYFKVRGGIIFYSKGVLHPPWGVVGYPKYIPSDQGERVDPETGVRYRKEESMEKQLEIARQLFPNTVVHDPHVGALAPIIPLNVIEKIYEPVSKAREIIEVENAKGLLRDLKDMIKDLIEGSEAGNIGVSGSVLVNLHTPSSDIDIVVYGEEDGRRVYEYLRRVVPEERRGYRRYSEENMIRLMRFRGKETPLPRNVFAKQLRRKVLEGFYRDREYFIRLVKPPRPDEEYGQAVYRQLGTALLKLRVVDARDAIFTPCRYLVEPIGPVDGVKSKISEIYSLRGRFTELASEGDIVVARGRLEEVCYLKTSEKSYRLYIGYPGDYLVNLSDT